MSPAARWTSRALIATETARTAARPNQRDDDLRTPSRSSAGRSSCATSAGPVKSLSNRLACARTSARLAGRYEVASDGSRR